MERRTVFKPASFSTDPQMEFEFSIYYSTPTADPNTSLVHSIDSTDPAKINALLLQVADGATGDVHISIHGDMVSVSFPRAGHRTDASLHGTRQARLFFGRGEKPVVSIADYESLRRDVFAACETVTVQMGQMSLD